MTREPVAWVFNLDAEDELARGGSHTPSAATRARAEQLLPELRRLLGPGDEVVWPADGRPLSARRGRCWCPTPWALQTLARAGLAAEPAPSAAVLRAVNHRRFSHGLGSALPGARFVGSEPELVRALSDGALLATVSCERNWLLKRPLGYAGRGRRKIASADFTATDRTWIEAALRSGDGLQVEPFVARELDCGIHGWLEPGGALTLGAPTVQAIDASGRWLSSARAAAGQLGGGEVEELVAAARATAAALTQAGYFGPFGLDGFRWRGPDGAAHFHPRCDVNARYAMGWAIGMADVDALRASD